MVRYANLAPCACERQTIHEIEHAARAAGGLLGETIPIICSCSQNEGRHAGTSARKVCEGKAGALTEKDQQRWVPHAAGRQPGCT